MPKPKSAESGKARQYFINSEEKKMTKNSAIKCDVSSCKYNLANEHYCTLDTIKVGTHEANPTVPECTDCMSFVCKNCQ